MNFYSINGLFKEIFFAKSVSYKDIFLLTRYYYPKRRPKFGFIWQKAYTAYVDIEKSEEEILSNFKKNTKYEINRAKREGVEYKISNDIDFFYNYYNEFAKSKNLELLNYNTLLKYKDFIVISQAVKDGEVLSTHIHLLDKDNKIAILLYSASLFRKIEDKKLRNLIGYANRFLHYQDMLYFKSKGCSIYDFGGYAYGTNDEVEKRINHFKDSFNCIPIERGIYTSWALNLILKFKNLLSLFGLRIRKL